MKDRSNTSKSKNNKKPKKRHQQLILVTDKYLICALFARGIGAKTTFYKYPDFNAQCLFANSKELRRFIESYEAGALFVSASDYAKQLNDLYEWLYEDQHYMAYFLKHKFKNKR